jgi:hypothetical protein
MPHQVKSKSEFTLVPLTTERINIVESWLGLKGNGRLESYFTNPVNDPKVLEYIKNMLFQEVVSQQGHETAKIAVRNYMKVNEQAAKLLEDCYYDLVSDLYSQIDRAIANQNAIRLGLNYAIYEGGLTTFSRNFCKEHNGKVYTREEIAAFKPETNLPNYNPFQDIGGIGCRHHLNWVSYSIAMVYRPDLKK